mmetsp:Transcript_13396/g.38554  ORF Transcript_13396/g.38554 Transcript_13396/m.38554 type:complete len:314 (-) Transcript_13396:620-1561(-)
MRGPARPRTRRPNDETTPNLERPLALQQRHAGLAKESAARLGLCGLLDNGLRFGEPRPQPPKTSLAIERCTSAVVSRTSRAPTTNAVIVSDSSAIQPSVAVRPNTFLRPTRFAVNMSDRAPSPLNGHASAPPRRMRGRRSGDAEYGRHPLLLGDVSTPRHDIGDLDQSTLLASSLEVPGLHASRRDECRGCAMSSVASSRLRSCAGKDCCCNIALPASLPDVAHWLLDAPAAVKRLMGLRSTIARHSATAGSVKRCAPERSGSPLAPEGLKSKSPRSSASSFNIPLLSRKGCKPPNITWYIETPAAQTSAGKL